MENKYDNHINTLAGSAEIGASNSAIFPELHLDGATKITGVKSLRGCLKKCIKTENGIAATIADLITTATAPATNLPYRCFGIEYDFITHTCFIHTTFTIQIQIGTPGKLINHGNLPYCPISYERVTFHTKRNNWESG